MPRRPRRHRPLGRLALAAGALLALTRCGACDCGFGGKPPPVLAPKAGTAGTVKAPVAASRLAAGLDAKGRVVLALAGHAGTLTFATRVGDGWETEPVLQSPEIGPLALAVAPGSGEAVIATTVHPDPDLGAAPIDAPPGAATRGAGQAPSPTQPAATGEVVVARRRLPRLWRLRPVALGAADPDVAVDARGRVHVVFLQPVDTGGPRGGSLVVYARLDATGVTRSVVGQTTVPIPPRIALVHGRPEVAYVAGGPQVLIATAGSGDTFSGRPVPAGILGVPAAPPAALAFLARPGVPPVLAFVRFLGSGPFHLFGDPAPLPAVSTKRRALLMVARFDLKGPEAQVLAVLPDHGEGATVALGASPAGLQIAATAGGIPVVALHRPLGWHVAVPASGAGTAASLAGPRPVLLLGADRVHLGAAPKASRVGPR